MDPPSDKPLTAQTEDSVNPQTRQVVSTEAAPANEATSSKPTNQPSLPTQPDLSRPPFSPRVVTSATLFGGDRQILIEHAGATYRLQITKQGKLILTK